MAARKGRTAAVFAALGLSACATMMGQREFVGPEWVVQDISGMRPLHQSSLTLTLSPDGHASGSGGCNRFVGSWRQAGDRLTLSGLGTTMMACDEALMSQEAAYLKALEGVSRFEATPERLVLRTADGHTFSFVPNR